MSLKQKLIDGLNEDLNRELEAVVRYLYHSATATSLLGHELRELLKGDIAGELAHAVFLADKIEDQHKAHVWDELKACYHSPQFGEEPFVHAGVKMLDGVKIFWDGLGDSRHPKTRVA